MSGVLKCLKNTTDKVLEQLEQMVDKRTSLSRAAMRRILERLNTRLAELNAGG
jgi:hypothetical protein